MALASIRTRTQRSPASASEPDHAGPSFPPADRSSPPSLPAGSIAPFPRRERFRLGGCHPAADDVEALPAALTRGTPPFDLNPRSCGAVRFEWLPHRGSWRARRARLRGPLRRSRSAWHTPPLRAGFTIWVTRHNAAHSPPPRPGAQSTAPQSRIEVKRRGKPRVGCVSPRTVDPGQRERRLVPGVSPGGRRLSREGRGENSVAHISLRRCIAGFSAG
jgi:hypothetical protein